MQTKPFDSFVDQAAVPIAIFDTGLRFVRVNRAMARIHRMPVKAYLGKTVGEVLPALSKQIQPILVKVLTTGEPAVVRIDGNDPVCFGVPDRCLAACFRCGESQIAIMALEARERTTADALQRSNRQLETAIADLEQSVLVNELAYCLQASMMAEDLCRIVARFAPRLFPRNSGALSVIDFSKNVVETTAVWGNRAADQPVFSPKDCCTLQEGRAHLLLRSQEGSICQHAASGRRRAQICAPLGAQSSVLGFLHLEASAEASSEDPFTLKDLRLARIVARQVAVSIANIRSSEVLRQQAFRDPLTGLYNRRLLQEALDIELRRAKRKKWPVGLIMIDVDDFKLFNDTYGHAAGDFLLLSLASFLQSSVRANDVLCRYGGDEFLLVMPETSLEDALLWTHKWKSAARGRSIEWNGRMLRCPTVSMGVAAYPACPTSDALFREADAALYAAKADGREQLRPAISALPKPLRSVRSG